jgi:hypothetical protein
VEETKKDSPLEIIQTFDYILLEDDRIRYLERIILVVASLDDVRKDCRVDKAFTPTVIVDQSSTSESRKGRTGVSIELSSLRIVAGAKATPSIKKEIVD